MRCAGGRACVLPYWNGKCLSAWFVMLCCLESGPIQTWGVQCNDGYWCSIRAAAEFNKVHLLRHGNRLDSCYFFQIKYWCTAALSWFYTGRPKRFLGNRWRIIFLANDDTRNDMQFKIDPEQLLREIPGKQKLGYANALIYITKRYKNCSESMVRAKWAIYYAWVLLVE